MNRIVICNTVALDLFTTGLYAQQPAIDNGCSNATLKGSYGVIVTGIAAAASVMPNFPSAFYPIGSLEQIAGVVIHTFDRNGKFTQVDNVKGYLSGITFDRPGGGTYSVNADCTGTYSIFIPGLSFPVIVTRFVIVDGGKEFRAVVVIPQSNTVIANGRKMN